MHTHAHTHARSKLSFGRCLVRISAETLVFRDFLSPSRKVSGQHFKLRHVRFLPNFIDVIQSFASLQEYCLKIGHNRFPVHGLYSATNLLLYYIISFPSYLLRLGGFCVLPPPPLSPRAQPAGP